MTLNEIERALGQVLDTGQLGTPVAMRIHAAVPGLAGEIINPMGVFAPLVRLISEDSKGQVQARRHPRGNHLTVLWTDARGRTVFITLSTAPTASQSLQVLLVGNRGITKLTGGEAWYEEIPPEQSPLWIREIAQSLKDGTSIRVKSS